MKHPINWILTSFLLYMIFMTYELKSMNDFFKKTSQDIHKMNIEIEEAFNHINSFYYLLNQIPLGSPLDSIEVTSKYGWRHNRKHKGIDLDGTYKDQIYVTADGVVKEAGWMYGYGKCVIVDHLNGYTTLYAHLRTILVEKDEIICKGHVLGTVGSTGFSTGTHLHYEVKYLEESEDPYPFIFFEEEI